MIFPRNKRQEDIFRITRKKQFRSQQQNHDLMNNEHNFDANHLSVCMSAGSSPVES